MTTITSTPPPVFSSHLQAFDLSLLKLQLGLEFTDLGLLPAHKGFLHHGLFLELQLALEGLHLRHKHTSGFHMVTGGANVWLYENL